MKVFACFAASLDGKISFPDKQKYVRISSDEDIAHLKRIRDKADALMMGGATFRAWPIPHLGSQLETSSERVAVHCILTRGSHPHRDIPPDSPIFKSKTPIRVLIFTETLPSEDEKASYPETVTWVHTPSTTPQEKVTSILSTLESEGIQALLIEGGGEIFGLFLKAHAVQELYLTLCPLLIGGEKAPGLLSGEGFDSTPDQQPPKTEIRSIQTIGQEIYLHMAIQY